MSIKANKPNPDPVVNKEEKKKKKREARKEHKAALKEEKAMRSKPGLVRAFKKHKKAFIAGIAILVIADIFGIAYLLSPGTFNSDSYEMLSYKKCIALADSSNYTYSKKSDKDEAAEALFSKLVNDTDYIKTPKMQYKAEKERLEKQYQDMAKSYGMSYDEMKKAMGATEKDWNKQIASAAKQTVKIKLVAHNYAKANNVKLTRDGYNKYCQEILKETGLSEKEFEKQTGTSFKEYCKANDMYSAYVEEEVGKDLYKKASPKKVIKSEKSEKE